MDLASAKISMGDNILQSSDFIEFWKERYLFEIEYQNKLYEKIGIHLAIITMIIGALGFMLSNLHVFDSGKISFVFFALLAITILSLVICIYYLVRSIIKYEYAHLPNSSEINEYLIKLDEYYKNPAIKTKDKNKLLINDLNEIIAGYYVKASSQNMDNNVKRSAKIYNATRALIVTLIMLSITLAPFFYKYSIYKKNEAKEINKIIQ